MCVRLSPEWQVTVTEGETIEETSSKPRTGWATSEPACGFRRMSSISPSMLFAVFLHDQRIPSPTINGAISANCQTSEKLCCVNVCAMTSLLLCQAHPREL